MPKKSAARAGAQRAKTRSQKGFELVLPASAAPAAPAESDETSQDVQETQDVQDIPVQKTASAKLSKASSVADRSKAKAATVEKPTSVETTKSEQRTITAASADETEEEGNGAAAVATVAPPKGGSAAARLAARRNAAQRNAQRANALITPEHYQYVRHDLMLIAILALIMFAVIIGLHFVPGIGY
jgi:hypothetical protein